MKFFGWVLERETDLHARDMRWFMRGLDHGWSSAMDSAEKEMNKHGITVVRASPETIEKFNLSRAAS